MPLKDNYKHMKKSNNYYYSKFFNLLLRNKHFLSALLLTFIFIFTISCSNIKKNDKRFLIALNNCWDFNSLFFRNHCIKVSPSYGFENGINDTITVAGFSGEIDTINYTFQASLTSDQPLSIDDIEKYFAEKGIYDHSLRQKIYWLCKVTYSQLNTIRDSYGDIEGYYVISDNQIIPADYYIISTNFLGKNELSPNVQDLGEYKYDGNSITFELLLDKVNEYQKSHMESYQIPISLDNSGLNIKPNNGYRFYLRVRVYSIIKLIIAKKITYPVYYHNFSPFKISEIK